MYFSFLISVICHQNNYCDHIIIIRCLLLSFVVTMCWVTSLSPPFKEVKWSEVTQLCLTLCDPMDCSLSGSSAHGIFQARALEWIAILFSRGSSRPRDRTWVSRIGGRCFNLWATRDAAWLMPVSEGARWSHWPLTIIKAYVNQLQ